MPDVIGPPQPGQPGAAPTFYDNQDVFGLVVEGLTGLKHRPLPPAPPPSIVQPFFSFQPMLPYFTNPTVTVPAPPVQLPTVVIPPMWDRDP